MKKLLLALLTISYQLSAIFFPPPAYAVPTALGDVPTDPTEFVAWVLARAVGIGGGLAFVLMLFGAYQIITSSGDPKKLQEGKEKITAALSGLLFIIFSLFLLKLIGVDILSIPGLTFKP
jgi:hypothetical protein